MTDTVSDPPVAARARRRRPSRRRRRSACRPPWIGFLGVPTELLYSPSFTPEQLVALFKLMAYAKWEPAGVPVLGRGYAVFLDVGEALISVRDFGSTDLGMDGEAGRSFVRRLLDKTDAAGITTRRPATDPRSGPRAGPRGDPPPTIVRFLKWRAWTWPKSIETDPPSDPPHVATATPYNKGTLNLEHGGGDTPSRLALASLPTEITDLKRDIEARIGRDLFVPTDPVNRNHMIQVFREWLAACGHDDVVGACAQEAKGRDDVHSLYWFARCWVRLSDNYEGPELSA